MTCTCASKEHYKEMVGDLINEKLLLKEQLHKSREREVQLECIVADLKADYLDIGGDKSNIEYIEGQCNRITINKWREQDDN